MASFPNKMPALFSGEITDANQKAIAREYDDPSALGPFVAGTDGFKRFVMSGRTFKWVYTQRTSLSGEVFTLALVGCELKHSVAAGGIPVLTAGSGVFWGNGAIAKLNNDTGHYQTSVESLERVRNAWMELDFIKAVEFKERTDFAMVLQGMGKQQKKGWF